MRFQFVFGFILLILFFIAVFIGLPYFLQIIKPNQFFKFSFPQLETPRLETPFPSSTSTTRQPLSRPKISMNVYRYGQRQINLSAAYSESGSIDITGWRIVSLQRGETIIGKGLALPQFSSFSSDIRLDSGHSVKIIAGLSPLLSNFQVNSCFGWLNNIYNIDSSLNYCPLIQISDLTGLGLDSACQNLIRNSGSCRAPSDTVLNNYSRECRIWVEQNLNYNTCVKKHMNEPDFYKGWQIYTGNDNLFYDQLHDRLELRDQSGRLVDSYEY